MLINKNKPVINDTVAFRVGAGDEVIGKLVQDTETYVTIATPLVAIVQQTANGMGLSFAPFIVSIDEGMEITFYKASMMTAPVKARKDIDDNYRKITSPIELPKKGLIIP